MSSNEPTLARKIWGLLPASERRASIGLLGLMFVGMILETLGVGLVIPAIATFTKPDAIRDVPMLDSLIRRFGNPSQQAIVVSGMLALLAAYVVKTAFLALLAWQQFRFAYSVQAQLSQRLFAVYLSQPYAFHLRRNSSQLIRNAIYEVGSFVGSGILPAVLLITESLVIIGLCTLLLVIEPQGALIVVVVLAVAALAFHRVTRKRILRWGEARLKHEGLRIQYLQEGLGGVKEVKLLGREAAFLDQYRVHNLQSTRAAQLQGTLQTFPRLWLELLAVSGLVIVVVSMLAQNRSLESIVPTLALFAAAGFRLIPSVNRMLGAAQLLRYGLPVVDVLHEELSLETREPPRPRGRESAFRDALQLVNVSFTYPGAPRPALQDVSITIPRGASVGFVGTSGAGKSTLVDIILGLFQPDQGEVLLDGENVRKDPRAWQDQIGYVPQSIFLTDDTLRRNVAFGLADHKIDDLAVERAIRAAQLEEFVTSLTEGLETVVGERGVRLSGGQRQRIGIARALYHDPPVLVLDEATSSLDVATERGIIDAVTSFRGAKTLLIVAHRLSTVEHCDKLYRLEGGRIAAESSPPDGASTLRLATKPR